MNTRKAMKSIGVGIAVFAIAVVGGMLGSRLGGTSTETSAPESVFVSGSAGGENRAPWSGTAAGAVSASLPGSFRDVVAQTLPVVVEVNVVNRVTRQVGPSAFDFFFRRPDNEEPEERSFEQEGLGSGVIVRRDGTTAYVLTNDHVAGDADEIEVVLHDGRSFAGEIVGSDERMDLALISFSTTEEVPVARLGDSSDLRPGDWVFAVGNPLGFESTVTAGIVSATARSAAPGGRLSGVTDYIQTDAAINRGNSGGPLVNLDGEVVGINTWIASQTGGSIGLGFSIPINNARRAISDFIAEGEVAYSWLGVLVSTPGEDLREDLGLEASSGALVSGVFEGSPAEESGILPGDVILEIGGRSVQDSAGVVRQISALEPGAETDFTVLRDFERMQLSVATARRTQDSADPARIWPGFAVAARDEQAPGVVIVEVQPQTAAGQSGLRPGDVIQSLNGERIDSVPGFYRELNRAGGELQLRIRREGRELILGFVR